MQLNMLKKDKYAREKSQKAMNTEELKKYAEEVLSRIDKVDLKSFDFEKDPDLHSRIVM